MDQFQNNVLLVVPETQAPILPATSTTGTQASAELMTVFEPNVLYGCIFDAVQDMPNELAKWVIRPSQPYTDDEYKEMFYGPVYVGEFYTSGTNWVLRSQGEKYGYSRGNVFNFITLGYDSVAPVQVLGHRTYNFPQGNVGMWNRPPLFFKITGVTRDTLPEIITPSTPGLDITQAGVPMVPFQYCQPLGGIPGGSIKH